MTKYREILRLKSLNLSQQNIAHSCNVSKKTVNRVLKRAEELGIFINRPENTNFFCPLLDSRPRVKAGIRT